MILKEIDPVSSSAEILPKIQHILNKLSSDTITNTDAVADLKTIKSDVYVQSRLSAEHQKDVYDWQLLIMTIDNILADIDDR